MSKNIIISLNTCRKIFIERDYSKGLTVKFVTTFPLALEGIVTFFLLFYFIFCILYFRFAKKIGITRLKLLIKNLLLQKEYFFKLYYY